MQISHIADTHEFDKLKSDWDSVYVVDPHATIFVSWAWLRGWFEARPDRWLVLAARPYDTSSYVAFLALTLDTSRGKLEMGGNPLADHTGFVCLPEYEEEAIATFAVFVQQQLRWVRFHMRDVFDPRLDLFLKNFSPTGFNVQEVESTLCPYIPLPDTWEQYLQDFLGPSTRRRLRRSMRQIEGLNGFHVTYAQSDNLEHQIETLLTLWQLRWGPKPDHILERFRVIFRRCFENNCLWLPVLWKADTSIVATACFVDRQKKTISDYIGGWNDQFAQYSPGKAVIGYGIRYAIKNGFQVFDLLRGDESYKFSFGSRERFNTNIIITRKSLRLTARELMRRLRRY